MTAIEVRKVCLAAAIAVVFLFLTVPIGAGENPPIRKYDPPPFNYKSDGVLSSGQRYSIIIKESPYVRRPDEPEDDGGRWGGDGGFPLLFVSNLRLDVDGNDIWIPRKLYEDLSYVRTAEAYDSGDA